MSHTIGYSFVVLFLISSTFSLPAPQVTQAQESNDGFGDILKVGVSVAETIMALLLQKINFVTSLLADKEFNESLGATVEAGVNITGQALRVVVPAAQGLLAAVPGLITTGSRFAGSVVRATNDTAPLVLQGISEFTDQIPLIASFATAYAEVQQEQNEMVAQTFARSLSCDLECRDLRQGRTKAECEAKFCQKAGETS